MNQLLLAKFKILALICAATWDNGDPEWVRRGKDGKFASRSSVSVEDADLDSLSQELVDAIEQVKRGGSAIAKITFEKARKSILDRTDKLSESAKQGAEKMLTEIDKALSADHRYANIKVSFRDAGQNIKDTAKRMQTDAGKQDVATGFLLGAMVAAFIPLIVFRDESPSFSYVDLVERVDFKSLNAKEKELIVWADKYVADFHAAQADKDQFEYVLPMTKKNVDTMLPIADRILKKHAK